MDTDLDKMSEQQLRQLNREIVSRLKMIAAVRRTTALAAFRIGDHVAFETDHGTVTGTIIRINQKTASIDADDGRGWRVSPGALSKIAEGPPEAQANLFHFERKQTIS
jgi:hypothetical protein